MRRYGASLLIALCLAGFVMAESTDSLPSRKQIETLSANSDKTFSDMLEATIGERLKYHINSVLNDSDAKRLCQLSQNAASRLESIANTQKRMLDTIEDYQGQDWDDLFGGTGLWRRLSGDIRISQVYKAQADLWQGISVGGKAGENILRETIAQCESDQDKRISLDMSLIKAKALLALSPGWPEAEKMAIESLSPILLSSISQEMAVRAKLLIQEASKLPESKTIKELYGIIDDNKLRNDFEIHVRLAMCLCRTGDDSLLIETLDKWPASDVLIGSVLLADIDSENLNSKSILQVTLAARATEVDPSKENLEKLRGICMEKKFQTPSMLLSAARAFQISDPAQAVKYYLLAADARQSEKSDNLESTAADIARHGAVLACRLCQENPEYNSLAKDALSRYCKIAGDGSDPQIKYFYAVLLNTPDNADNAVKLFKELSYSTGPYAAAAKLELLKSRANADSDDPVKRDKIIKELTNFIYSANPSDENTRNLRLQAIEICTALLIENGDRTSAEKVITMLEGFDIINEGRFTVVKAKALHLLGEFAIAAKTLTKYITPDNCDALDCPLEILTEMTSQVEIIRDNRQEFVQFLDDTEKLARHCMQCQNTVFRDQASLVLAELLVLRPEADADTLDEAENILARIDTELYRRNAEYLRTHARLLTARGEFASASIMWKKTAEVAGEHRFISTRANEQWWQSKYYAILCFSKIDGSTSDQVIHAIDVILTSGFDGPALWVSRFSRLKKQLEQKLD